MTRIWAGVEEVEASIRTQLCEWRGRLSIDCLQRNHKFIAIHGLGIHGVRAALVGDSASMALTQLSAYIKSQTAGAAFGREEWFEQVAFHGLFHRVPITPDADADLQLIDCLTVHLNRCRTGACVARGIVQ